MDDLAEKLNQILNDPKAMQQVSALAGMLGSEGKQPPSPSPAVNSTPDLSALAGLLGGQPAPQSIAPAESSTDMMQAVMKILPLLRSLDMEDDSTRLLRSLRPLLGKERQKRLDEVTKMMRLFRLLPMLRSGGVL